jgi:hypothetical protein
MSQENAQGEEDRNEDQWPMAMGVRKLHSELLYSIPRQTKTNGRGAKSGG